jgi:hypothetical protein
MASDIYEERIPHFLYNILSTPVGSVWRGAQWVVSFDNLAGRVLPSIQKALKYEGKDWLIDKASNAVLGDDYQNNKGCVFAQAITVPGESIVVNAEGNIMSNAFLRSYVGQGRNQMPEMQMTFLDTNVSFADNFLRPWVISTGTFGLWAGGKDSYRTDIYCYKLAPYDSSQDNPDAVPGVVMTMTFFDACCISVSNEELNYAPQTTTPMRQASFIYNYYSVDTTSSNPFVG